VYRAKPSQNAHTGAAFYYCHVVARELPNPARPYILTKPPVVVFYFKDIDGVSFLKGAIRRINDLIRKFGTGSSNHPAT
jgi:hypothetical protein